MRTMKTMSGTLKAAFGAAILTAALASLANAQCGNIPASHRGALLLRQRSSAGVLRPAAFWPAAFGGSEASPAAGAEPIVGFWTFKLLAEHNAGVPDGTVIDAGYTQWHSDGTEIMNSSRPPQTESFCLGVWAKTGPSTYKLNHFAIAWNPDGTRLGPARIQETVTVSPDHNTYTGTFTLDQYNQAGAVQLHRVGRIEGRRITVNTSITGALLD
jgi:hypothetical protein